MPIYEYQCQKCQHQFETIRKISDPPLVTCPTCGADSLKKLVSKAAFRLKGGGWYETDFKDEKKQKNVIKKEEAAGEKAEAKPDKAGKKPETTKETTPKTEAKPKEKKSKKAAED
jgi:putative FmdB family regulatory protein